MLSNPLTLMRQYFAVHSAYGSRSIVSSRLASPLGALALALAILAAVWHALSYIYVTSDDAYISFRYAANLAANNGYV